MFGKKWTLGVAFTLVAISGVMVYGRVGPAPIKVNTVKVKHQDISSSVSAVGTLIARRQVSIKSPRNGVIVELKVQNDQFVKKGDILLRLDDPDLYAELEKARSVLGRYQAEKEKIENSLRRSEELFAAGAMAGKAVIDTRIELRAMNARIEEAQQDIKIGQLNLDKLIVKSPFSGTVTDKRIEVGERVTQGVELFTLIDLKSMEVTAKVDAGDVGGIVKGQPVVISTDAYPELHLSAIVEELSSVIGSEDKENTKSLTVRISTQSSLRPLRVGEQVDVLIQKASRKNALVLPFNALTSRNGKTIAGTVVGEKIQYVAITTGIEDLTHTEISSGLKEGDEVIVFDGPVPLAGQTIERQK